MPESCCPSRSKYHNDALSYCVRSVWVHTRCTTVEPLTLWIRWLRLSHLGHKVLVVQKCYHPAMSPSSTAVAQCLSLVLRDLWEKSSSRSCSALVQDSNPSTCWLDPHRRRTAKLVSRSSSITKLVLTIIFFLKKFFFLWLLLKFVYNHCDQKKFPTQKGFRHHQTGAARITKKADCYGGRRDPALLWSFTYWSATLDRHCLCRFQLSGYGEVWWGLENRHRNER